MHRRKTISVVLYLAALAQTAIVSVFFFGGLRNGESTIFNILRFAEWLPAQTGLFCLAAFLMPSITWNGPVLEKKPTFLLRVFSLLAFFLSPFVVWVVKMEMYGVPMVPTRPHLYMQCMGLLSIVSFLFLQVAYARTFSKFRHPRPNFLSRIALAMPLYLTVVPCFAVFTGAFYLIMCEGGDGRAFKLFPNLMWVVMQRGLPERAGQILLMILGSVFFQYAAMLPYLFKHGFSEANASKSVCPEPLAGANVPAEQQCAPEPISIEACGENECSAQSIESENSNEEDSANQCP